ncbi:MAG TPA: hypothetical protein PK125_11350, partial [Syntrophorhabdus sp.]|nr:hypothetical protein [Syntrophorhabdus sp.]
MMNMKIARIAFQNLFSHPCLFCLVTLLLVFPVTLVHSGAIELPQTGQITCYSSSGNPIPCDNTGQDGDFIAGVS